MNQRENFSSKLGIIVATAGSALGLGNIYRFPCEAGANGGGAFLIVYLVIALLIGTPLMVSEFVIGRRSRSNPIGAFRLLAGKKKAWPVVGYLGVVCAFLILAFYTTVAGWTLGYLGKSAANHFAGQDLVQIQSQFMHFTNHPWLPVVCQLLFLALTAFVVARGVKDGIEKWSKILMPLLLVIMVVLCINSLTLGGAKEGLSFFFNPDFSKINGRVLISALGQAFFSLSIGMGALITYGSYIGQKDNMVSSAAGTAIIGVVATLSFRDGSPLHIGGRTVFDLLDHMTASYFMPIGGLLIVLFVGWKMKRADVLDELTNGGALRAGLRKAILFIIRYLAPVAIAVIFISQLLK